MGELALQGRDKLTFIVSEPVSSFGIWVEQLIAESTGKEGKGILPVADEPLGDPEAYGDDRVFAYLRNADEPDEELDAKVEALAKAGHAVITASTRGGPVGPRAGCSSSPSSPPRWRAGCSGINAFDQPNVQEAKDNTAKVLEAAEPPLGRRGRRRGAAGAAGRCRARPATWRSWPTCSRRRSSTRRWPSCARRSATPPRPPPRSATAPASCTPPASCTRAARPPGCFLQIVHDGDEDVEIPDADYTFKELKNAQATGDILTLRDHGLPAERVRLEGDPVDALRALTERVRGLL